MKGTYDTALGIAVAGVTAEHVAIVDTLLRAGADPNLMSHRDRPLWLAFGVMRTQASLGREQTLVAQGLDVNAEYQRARVLVEAQAGVNSELGVTLRRLGAR